jgi:hypothetical protein
MRLFWFQNEAHLGTKYSKMHRLTHEVPRYFFNSSTPYLSADRWEQLFMMDLTPIAYTDKKEKKLSSYIRKFGVEQLQIHIQYEGGLPNIWVNAQIFLHIWGGVSHIWLCLQLLHSEYPYKFDFLFYQCTGLVLVHWRPVIVIGDIFVYDWLNVPECCQLVQDSPVATPLVPLHRKAE